MFRGVALLLILWAHLRRDMVGADHLLFRMNPAGWALSDAADMFVFLSGVVYGLAYRRPYAHGGARAVLTKSVLRAWELYLVNLLTFAFVVALVAWAALDLAPEATRTVRAVAALLDRPFETLRGAPLLEFGLPFFDILVLYIGLLLLAPGLYVALRWRWWAGLGASLGLYGIAQAGVNPTGAFFNLFAWQLPFVLGAALSTYRPSVPRRRGWAALAVVLGVGATLSVRLMNPLAAHGLVPDLGWTRILAFAEKPDLEPLRVVHFACLVYIVHYVTRAEGGVWGSAVLAPFRTASRHSLGVFAFGVVCTYAGILASHALQTGPVGAAAIIAGACAASLVAAYVLDWRRTEAAASPRPSAVA